MKILQAIAPGPMAGAEKSVLSSTHALHISGHDVILLAIWERRVPECAEAFVAQARQDGLCAMTLDARGRLDPFLLFQLRSLLMARGFDIVHAHGYKILTYLTPLKKYCPTLIATYHGATSHTATIKIYERIERHLFEKVDRLFVVSQGALDDLRYRGLKTDRCSVIPNALSPTFFAKHKQGIRNPDEALQLLFLGRLSREKGLDVLISALQMLGEFPFRLSVVGDGPARHSIETQLRQSRLGDKIHMLGFQQDVKPFLATTDVLVMPSRTEGLPMALIEAATFGLPVIASRVGGIDEIIDHGKNGLLVEPDQPEQLAEAIKKLYSHLGKFQKAGRSMKQEIQDRYSSKTIVKRIVSEYRKSLT